MASEKQRYELLDGLRGMAMAAVMIEHFAGLPINYFGFGYYGVDLFFVLSGFLITGILLKCPGNSFLANLWNFSGRRAMRIFPPYFLLLLLLVMLDYRGARENILPLATYTWNYFCIDSDPFYLWSLSVEEQFYLIWPMAILALRGNRRSAFVFVSLLAVASYCQLMYGVVDWLSKFNYTGLPNRMGSLCVGALGAFVVGHEGRLGRFMNSRVVEFVCIVVILVSGMSLRAETGFVGRFRAAYPLMALCSMIIVLKCVRINGCSGLMKAILSQPLLVLFGRMSYVIYLIHVPFGEWIREELVGPIWHRLPFESLGPLALLRWQAWLVVLPCVTVGSLLCAMLSWRIMERPLMNLKDQWFPSA
jgi:peptidoglycan/LPS O-acetylase OafA/YrhL